jgi:hypothetical protein
MEVHEWVVEHKEEVDQSPRQILKAIATWKRAGLKVCREEVACDAMRKREFQKALGSRDER